VIGEKDFQEIFEVKMVQGTYGLVGIINKIDVGIGIPQTTYGFSLTTVQENNEIADEYAR